MDNDETMHPSDLSPEQTTEVLGLLLETLGYRIKREAVPLYHHRNDTDGFYLEKKE